MKIKPPSKKEYERTELELKLAYAPETHPCKFCKWPVLKGFCCDTCGSTSPIDHEQK